MERDWMRARLEYRGWIGINKMPPTEVCLFAGLLGRRFGAALDMTLLQTRAVLAAAKVLRGW